MDLAITAWGISWCKKLGKVQHEEVMYQVKWFTFCLEGDDYLSRVYLIVACA